VSHDSASAACSPLSLHAALPISDYRAPSPGSSPSFVPNSRPIIAIDAMGGDNAPDVVVKGVLSVDPATCDVILVGQEDRLKSLRSEEHTSELQSQSNLVCRLLLE